MAFIVLLSNLVFVAGQWLFSEERMPQSLLAGHSFGWVQVKHSLHKINGAVTDLWLILSEVAGNFLRICFPGTKILIVLVHFQQLVVYSNIVGLEISDHFVDSLHLGILSLFYLSQSLLLNRTYPVKNSTRTHPRDHTSILSV
jgi:hypothetical protein